MSENVVLLDSAMAGRDLSDHLTPTEKAEMESLCGHPLTEGHILMDASAETLEARNISPDMAAVYANIFDVCQVLGGEIGQSDHKSITLESKTRQVICKKWSAAQLVVFRSRGGM